MRTKYCIKNSSTGAIAVSSISYWIVEALYNFYDHSIYVIDNLKIDI